MAINPLGTVLATGASDGEVHLAILPEAQDWVALEICDACTITEMEFNPTGTHLMVRTEEERTQHIHIYALPETLYRW
jgi:hypothetical protein